MHILLASHPMRAATSRWHSWRHAVDTLPAVGPGNRVASDMAMADNDFGVPFRSNAKSHPGRHFPMAFPRWLRDSLSPSALSRAGGR
jgi:hypothetical protein